MSHASNRSRIRLSLRRRVLLLAAAALMLAACVGGTSTASVSESDPSTSVQSTGAPTTSASTAGNCPAAPSIPPDASAVADYAGDPDGDGVPDAISTYTTADAGQVLRMELATGDVVEVTAVEPGTPIGGALFVGAHDLNDDGRDELFTRIGSGAATDLVGIWQLADCVLARVAVDGEPAVFPVGASAATVSGLICAPEFVDNLYAVSLATQDGQTYEGSIVGYDLADGVLTKTSSEGAAYPLDDLGAVSGLQCGQLTFR